MMTAITKRLVYPIMGLLIVFLAACAPAPTETPVAGSAQTPTTVAPGTATAEATEMATSTSTGPGAGASLENTGWALVSFEESGTETPVIEGTTVTLSFKKDGQAGGSGGCNSFGAQYDVQGGTLSFQRIVRTEMACTATGVNEQEGRYFQALQTATDFELVDDRLTIHYDDGRGALHFLKAANPATPTPVSDLLCSDAGAGAKPGWKLCRSQAYGFELQYPPQGQLVDQSATSARIDLQFTPRTNLTEKYLDIAVRQNPGTCSSPLAEGYAPGSITAEPVQFNGLEFTKETGQDAGAGNVYNWVAYSISREGLCVSMSFVLHSHPPELEPTPPPEYDVVAESQVFEEIVETFAWLGPTGNPAPTTQATGTPAPTPTPERIEFAAGATSATVSGDLEPGGSHRYVLRALEGQNMSVELSFSEGQAILAIWGEDGTVLISDHAGASHFEGVLPATQDYYIVVIGTPDGETDYSMKVTIP
jgi:heat shock protein HslJ